MRKENYMVRIFITILVVAVFSLNLFANENTDNTPKINFDIKTAYQRDESGEIIFNEFGVKAEQTLFVGG